MQPLSGDGHPALHRQEQSRRGFDEVVEAYGARPGYPPQLFDALFERCGLGPSARALEVGPGTGQVTVPLAQRGAEITAVELGPAMASRLRDATRGLTVNVIVGPSRQLRSPLATYSPVMALSRKRREPLLDRIEELAGDYPDGLVTRSYTTVMYVAERRSRASVR